MGAADNKPSGLSTAFADAIFKKGSAPKTPAKSKSSK